jgi:hypothetical protein
MSKRRIIIHPIYYNSNTNYPPNNEFTQIIANNLKEARNYLFIYNANFVYYQQGRIGGSGNAIVDVYRRDVHGTNNNTNSLGVPTGFLGYEQPGNISNNINLTDKFTFVNNINHDATNNELVTIALSNIYSYILHNKNITDIFYSISQENLNYKRSGLSLNIFSNHVWSQHNINNINRNFNNIFYGYLNKYVERIIDWSNSFNADKSIKNPVIKSIIKPVINPSVINPSKIIKPVIPSAKIIKPNSSQFSTPFSINNKKNKIYPVGENVAVGFINTQIAMRIQPNPIIGIQRTNVRTFIELGLANNNTLTYDQINANPNLKKYRKLYQILLEFPESSHLENYILFTQLLNINDLANITNTLINVVIDKQQTEIFPKNINMNDIINRFALNPATHNYVYGPPNPHKIDPRKLCSLMVLCSRLSPLSMLGYVNKEHELYNNLETLYHYNDFVSDRILYFFNDFINNSSAVTPTYFSNMIDGTTIYNIYKNHYFNKDTEITKSLIVTRLNDWLKSTDYTTLPVSFLFNKYSNKELAQIKKETLICNPISEIINNPFIKTKLNPSIFDIQPQSNEPVDFTKIQNLLSKMAPSAINQKKYMGKSSITKKSSIKKRTSTKKVHF